MNTNTENLLLHPVRRRVYQVLHPLDDVTEHKVDLDRLEPMRLTRTVRVCLYALRGYLILMTALLGLHVLHLAQWV